MEMDDEIRWEEVMFDWFPNLDPDSPEDQEEIGETLMGMWGES